MPQTPAYGVALPRALASLGVCGRRAQGRVTNNPWRHLQETLSRGTRARRVGGWAGEQVLGGDTWPRPPIPPPSTVTAPQRSPALPRAGGH